MTGERPSLLECDEINIKELDMLSKIAQRLLKSNKELKAIVLENEKSYKLLEAKITPRLLATIGKAEGVFIKRNELIWAIIDEASGASKGGELKY